MIRLDSMDFVFLGVKEPEVEMASNSTIEQDMHITKMTVTQLTVKIYEHLQSERPVNIDGKLPTLDDTRAIISAVHCMLQWLCVRSTPSRLYYSCLLFTSHLNNSDDIAGMEA